MLEKETMALASNREKWLSRKKQRDKESWWGSFQRTHKNRAAEERQPV